LIYFFFGGDLSPKALILGLLFAFIWSSAFTSARVIVSHAPPLGALFTEIFLIGHHSADNCYFGSGRTSSLQKTNCRQQLLFGICQNTIYLGLNFLAMQWIEASLAAIIASSMPLLVALLGWLFLGQRLSIIGVVGLGIGFLGVTIIMGFRLNTGISELGLIYCVLGAAALSIATLAVRITNSDKVT
jgi:drug/metabolite transporter (DMT)-like permease